MEILMFYKELEKEDQKHMVRSRERFTETGKISGDRTRRGRERRTQPPGP